MERTFPNRISVLSALGLTEDEFKAFDVDQRRERKLIPLLEGKAYVWLHAFLGPGTSGGINTVDIVDKNELYELARETQVRAADLLRVMEIPLQSPIFTADDLPDKLIGGLEYLKGNFSKNEYLKMQRLIKHFIRAYGQEAENNGLWETAVNAYDITSKNGVINNKEVMEKLKQHALADKATGVTIAKAILLRNSQSEE
jgi:hypothetical protein